VDCKQNLQDNYNNTMEALQEEQKKKEEAM
jgi:hypothetical protein